MLRFAIRHGLARMVGRRVVPIMIAYDVAVLANRARQIPIVDRGLRRGVGVARRGFGSVVASPRWRSRPRRPQRHTPKPDGSPDA